MCIKKSDLINFGPRIISIGGVDMENTITMKGIALFATLIGIYQWLGQGTSFMDILVLLFATALVISMDGGGQKHQVEQIVPNEEKETGDNQKIKRSNFFCRLTSNLAYAMAFVFMNGIFAEIVAKNQTALVLEPFYYYS